VAVQKPEKTIYIMLKNVKYETDRKITEFFIELSLKKKRIVVVL